MSAGVDQRTKGQSNQAGSKDPVKDSFDSYLPGPQTGVYNSPQMSSPNVSDQYMANYYPTMGFSYLNQGLGDGAWSNGGDPMFGLGYGQMNNDYMGSNGIFSGFGYSQPGFGGWDNTGYDYGWGSAPAQGRKNDTRSYRDDYYSHHDMGPMDNYGTMNGELDRDIGVKAIDQGLKGVSLTDGRDREGSTKENMKPLQSDPSASVSSVSSGSTAPKKMSWASVASQPAKPQPKMQPKSIPRAPVLSSKHNMDIGTWDTKNNAGGKPNSGQTRQNWSASSRPRSGMQYNSNNAQSAASAGQGSNNSSSATTGNGQNGTASTNDTAHPVLEKLKATNAYNPKDFALHKNARFFIIKSYSEDDIHRSIKYNIWCSTEHGNRRLDQAHKERDGKGPIYLFFSVNSSGHFCGMAQMISALDYDTNSGVWAQDKWKGQFKVKWIYVKDVPNSQLRHIRLENNDNKPVTNSRDTQEVPYEKGKQVWKIMNSYRHTTSIFDDFTHYEKRQLEDMGQPENEDSPPPAPSQHTKRNGHNKGRKNDNSEYQENGRQKRN